ncbi:MAG: alpha/beta hydrolase family protein [Holosporaceae bacterium]
MMKIIAVIISFIPSIVLGVVEESITPYKFSDEERRTGFVAYAIPKSSTFSVPRSQKDAPDLTYYLSKPKQHKAYPIVLFCSGSELRKSVSSVIHVHRYFLKEFLDLGVALITLEQWGVKGTQVHADEFMHHYTRTQRLLDHKTLINHLLSHPPEGWNGQFIFVGVSEGGPIVTALTTMYPDKTLATINWCGTSGWNWREELWAFLNNMRDQMLASVPWPIRLRSYLPSWVPYSVNLHLPETRPEYDQIMDQTMAAPTPTKEFVGMTYMYHADALSWPITDYTQIKSPYLAVAGARDFLIDSSDSFVKRARRAGVPITYLRVKDMDHYVRKRPDIIKKSLEWLEKFLHAP